MNARVALATVAIASGLVACGTILGFQELREGSADASAEGGSNGVASDGSAPDGTASDGAAPDGSAPKLVTDLVVSPALVTTLAGSGNAGFQDATGPGAAFNAPKGLAFSGPLLIVADSGNHRIRSVGSDGSVSTFAGSAKGDQDGDMGEARFDTPSGVASNGSLVYVADTGNNRIREIVGGVVYSIAGKPDAGNADGFNASFNGPRDLAFTGLSLVVADTGNGLIRNVPIPDGGVSTLGYILDAPTSVSLIDSSSYVVADSTKNRVCAVYPSGEVDCVGGPAAGFKDGPREAAAFALPSAVTVDATRLLVYVADTKNHAIRRVKLEGPLNTVPGTTVTIAGTGAPGFADGAGGRFNGPEGIALQASKIYVSDTQNHAIRTFDVPSPGKLHIGWTPVPGAPNNVAYSVTATSSGDTAVHTCTASAASPGHCALEGLEGGLSYTVTLTATAGAITESLTTKAVPLAD